MTKTLVYGRGESGQGAIELLSKINVDYDVYEDKIENSHNVLDGVDRLIVSPGISCDNQLIVDARRQGIEVIGEIELAYRQCFADIIAVTGTNGKTTTVNLIHKLLQEAGINSYLLGNVGESFAKNALNMKLDDVVVLELSSFQLETIKQFRPKIAVCLNITEDHLERHRTMENYANIKKRIFLNQKESDIAILNYDDKIVASWADTLCSNTYFCSINRPVRGAYISNGNIYFTDKATELVCSVSDVKLVGEHNLYNVLASVAVMKVLNMPNNLIKRVLNNFNAPPNRLEFVRNIRGVAYYNDSKATNVDATLKACCSMRGKTVLLMGGYDKGLNYSSFFEHLPLKCNTVICYGANRSKLIEQSNKLSSLTIIEATDLAEAVTVASRINTDNVLLSPATSSYDSYLNYEERGSHFVDLVKGLNGVK